LYRFVENYCHISEFNFMEASITTPPAFNLRSYGHHAIFKDKILVFPGTKGSSGTSMAFHATRLVGTAPKALIFNDMTTKAALSAVLLHAPRHYRTG
jgi:hypothetical protein